MLILEACLAGLDLNWAWDDCYLGPMPKARKRELCLMQQGEEAERRECRYHRASKTATPEWLRLLQCRKATSILTYHLALSGRGL